MKRTLFFCMAALIAGMYAAHFVPGLVSVLFFGVLALVLFALGFFKKAIRPFAFLVLCFLLGFVYMQAFDGPEAQALYPYAGEYVTLSGDVIEEAQVNPKDGSASLVVRVTHLSFLKDDFSLNEKVRLFVPAGETVPGFGESFTATCLLSVPAGKDNTGGFDYQLYLKSKRIYFTGRIERGTLVKTGRFSLTPLLHLYRLNRLCGRAISEHLPVEGAAVLRAVALGDKTTMPDALYDDLKISGLSHMTAVSGMHVTTFLTAIYVLLSLLKKNKHKFLLPVCGIIFLFMFFTGATPSVVRATIMSALALFAYMFYRKEDSLTSLGLAAGVIALVNPFSIFDAGFILSFGATLGILLFAEPIISRGLAWLHLEKSMKLWARIVRALVTMFGVTLSAQLLLLPVLSVMFGYASLWCFITNMLAAPVLSVLLVGGLLIGFLGLIHPWLSLPVVWFLYPFVKFFLGVVHFFGALDFGAVTLGAFRIFDVYVYGLFLFCLHRFLKKQYRSMVIAGTAFCVLIVCSLVVGVALPKAQVTFINVGQGDCTLLELPGDVTVLVDGGGLEYESDYDVGKEVVLPYLQKRGIRKLNYLVATHPHADHIGGLQAVVDNMPIETMLVPIGFQDDEAGAALVSAAAAKNATIAPLSAGKVLALGPDAELETLMPTSEWLEKTENDNDESLVFRVTYGENEVLFMGDLESGGESQLIGLHSAGDSTTLLKAGHHGSAGATSKAFLEWAKPQYVFIPCGQNHFGHPSPEMLARLEACGATVYRADQDLDVTFVFNKKEVQAIKKGGKTP